MKTKTAIIHTDAVRREYPGNWVLAQKLKDKGFEVSITSRITTKALVNLNTVDVLILSHPFTLSMTLVQKLKRKGENKRRTNDGMPEVVSMSYDLFIKLLNK